MTQRSSAERKEEVIWPKEKKLRRKSLKTGSGW